MIVLFCLMVLYPPAAAMTYDECLLNALKTAPAETSVEEIRSDCSRYLNPEISLPSDTGAKPETPDKPSAVSNRLEKEAQTFENPFALTPHRPNYILPATYSTSSNETPSTGSDYYSDNWEIKFQISLQISGMGQSVPKQRGYLFGLYQSVLVGGVQQR